MGVKCIDLTGQKFGRLTVIKRVNNTPSGTTWLCRCDCGNYTNVASCYLRSGKIKSCGCLRKEHNWDCGRVTHGGSRTRLYRIWRSMKRRCYSPKHIAFKRYGGRGITVCPEWIHDFGAFQEWAYSHGYRDDLTIDRIDNDKGYSPTNCRWATWAEQNANKRAPNGRRAV